MADPIIIDDDGDEASGSAETQPSHAGPSGTTGVLPQVELVQASNANDVQSVAQSVPHTREQPVKAEVRDESAPSGMSTVKEEIPVSTAQDNASRTMASGLPRPAGVHTEDVDMEEDDVDDDTSLIEDMMDDKDDDEAVGTLNTRREGETTWDPELAGLESLRIELGTR
jgi:hypothetical protein